MSWIKVNSTDASEIIQALLRDCTDIELTVGFDKTIKVRPAKEQKVKEGQLVPVTEHCWRLGTILSAPELLTKQPGIAIQGESLEWSNASEWLRIASGIEEVDLFTGKYDEAVGWCRPSWEYESQRSLLLSDFATELTIFLFAWGSLETIIKLVGPPKIPSHLKPGRSIIDDAIYYLQCEFEPKSPLPYYASILSKYRELISDSSNNKSIVEEFVLKPYMGITGLGIDIVRRIRNSFAHGAMKFPIPYDWIGIEPKDVEIISLSTRLTLLTAQMMLIAYIKNDSFKTDLFSNEEDMIPSEDEMMYALCCLHVRPIMSDLMQPSLFKTTNPIISNANK